MSQERMTTGEAAQALNCSVKKIRKLIAYGVLPAENIAPEGNRPTYRVAQSELAAFCERNATVNRRAVSRRRRVERTSGEVYQFLK